MAADKGMGGTDHGVAGSAGSFCWLQLFSRGEEANLQHPGPRHGELSACPLTTAENQTPYLLNYALQLLDPTYIQLAAEVFGPLTVFGNSFPSSVFTSGASPPTAHRRLELAPWSSIGGPPFLVKRTTVFSVFRS